MAGKSPRPHIACTWQGVAQGESGLDKGCVGEGLGVVAEVGVCGGIHLFGEQAEGAGEIEKVREPSGCFAGSAVRGEGLYQPERAGQEGTFASGLSVLAWGVAVDQRAAGIEVASYGVDGAPYAG